MDPVFVLILLLAILFLIMGVFAWYYAISMFIEIIKNKKSSKVSTGTLWFVGIWASPFVLGLYAVSLPDKGNTPVQSFDQNLPPIS